MQEPIDLNDVAGFEWDEGNATKNEQKHSVTKKESEEVFFNQPIIEYDKEHSQHEERYIAFGETDTNRKLYVVFTVRNKCIRVISSRDQDRKERSWYEQTIANTEI